MVDIFGFYISKVFILYIYIYIFEMAECFEFFDIKSRIITSFDTLPLDVDFGHLVEISAEAYSAAPDDVQTHRFDLRYATEGGEGKSGKEYYRVGFVDIPTHGIRIRGRILRDGRGKNRHASTNYGGVVFKKKARGGGEGG